MTVIDEFLLLWKKRAFEYYSNLYAEYLQQRQTDYDITKENLSIIKQGGLNKKKYSEERIFEIMNKVNCGELPKFMVDNYKAEIVLSKLQEWKESHTKSEVQIVEKMREKDFLQTMLNKEAENKKQQLIASVEKKAGKINDASCLFLGSNGEINGQIIGEKKTVFVQTIYAGGHNVQCLHYRVLVK